MNLRIGNLRQNVGKMKQMQKQKKEEREEKRKKIYASIIEW